MAVHKLYVLKKDAGKIAGVAVKGGGEVQWKESGSAVSPAGGLRVGKTCILAISEVLTFKMEDVTTANVPVVGTHGESEFDAYEMTGGTGRGAGIKGTAALSTVLDVGKGFSSTGKPTVDVTVQVESADEIATGMVWAAGAAPA